MAHKAVQRLIRIEADAEGNLPDRIHVLSVGHWHTPWHGAFEHKSSDLAAMIINFEEGIGLVDHKGKLEAPGNFGHDRGGKAAFWITGLFLENDGNEMWASVRWTKAGAQAVQDEEYKYISPEWNPRDFPWEDPEEEGKFVENVFTGAALTNIPLFKKLTPVMASADAGTGDKSRQHQGGDMDLAALRGKKKDELSAEELAFVEEHKNELTPEERQAFELETEDEEKAREEAEAKAEADRKAAEDEAAKGGNPKEASTGTVTIEASRLASLEADAKAGREASEKLRRSELTASVQAHVDRGAIKSDELDSTVNMLMASSEEAQRVQLDFIAKLPDNKMLARESGSASVEGSVVTVSDEELEMGEAFNLTPEQIKEYKEEQAKEGK